MLLGAPEVPWSASGCPGGTLGCSRGALWVLKKALENRAGGLGVVLGGVRGGSGGILGLAESFLTFL